MNLEISIKRVNQLMSRFVTEIKGEASMGRTDLNKAAETILIPLLNEIHGWNLVNVNYAEDDNNYPGIDLADKSAKVSIQVTATTSSKKVKHTLKQFVKYEQHLEYDRLIIFFLKERQSYTNKTIQTFQDIVQDKVGFDEEKDIWDWRNLLIEVANFQIEKVNKIRDILEANFGDDRQSKLEQKINWRETCQTLLDHWKGLTTNALTKSNGVRFQLDDVFVPLGVVEREHEPRHAHSDGLPEHGSGLYDEKVTPISQNDFFENVLRQGHGQYSQGQRIAIIGEPGAGKTTQLQKVGDWILKETDSIPIWIPLSAIGTKGLRDYLTQDWLQTAIPDLEVTEHHRDDLGQLLKTGKVWLLLDGADEMTISDALHHIATQMREGWLRNIRVVLTCRLNVWKAGKNALDSFDVYRNLDFEYPTEVYQFIDKWFREKPDLQQKLKATLEQPGKERIRDMVKNPLRLTLLCYSWQIRQGELPETKAGLYEWFLDAFYEWNKGKVPCKLNSAKRKELNRALGELAREAIDQNSSRFRLKGKFISHFLGDPEDEDSLFYLAQQLGWLNRIGIAEENPFENVYAFFHPTFQEYFAALTIDDWGYFLPCDHIDKPVINDVNEGCKFKYRVFQKEWLEVVCLWLGAKREFSQRNFAEKLLEFEDGEGGFFYFQAIFSLGKFLEEDCSIDITIARSAAAKVTEWTFGPLDTNSLTKAKLKPIKIVFRSALSIFKRLPYELRIEALENRFPGKYLENVDQDEGLALLEVLGQKKTKKEFQFLETLGKSEFFLVSSTAKRKLNALSPESFNCPKTLATMSPAQAKLNEALFRKENERISKELSQLSELARELEAIGDVECLKRYLVSFKQKGQRVQVIRRLSEISKDNPIVIDSIILLIDEVQDEEVFELLAWLLGESPLMKLSFVVCLIRIFKLSSNFLALQEATNTLMKVNQDSFLEIIACNLKEYLSPDTYKEVPQKYSFAFEVLWHCSHNMNYPTFYKAWHK